MISREEAHRRRTFRRASMAWAEGKPYAATEIILAAGLGDAVAREFVREAQRQARRTFHVRMARA